jgi:hypothetical protein
VHKAAAVAVAPNVLRGTLHCGPVLCFDRAETDYVRCVGRHPSYFLYLVKDSSTALSIQSGDP